MVRGRIYFFESFSLDVGARHLYHRGKPLHLTPKEFDLLALLVENAGRVVSKDEIFHSVWHDAAVEEGNLTQTVSLLRKAIGTEGAREAIETVPRHGYLFRARVTPAGRFCALGQGWPGLLLKGAFAALLLALWALVFYWLGARA